MSKSELGALLRTKRSAGSNEQEISITESYDEGVLFYTGDTTITLLRERWRDICRVYKYIIHEVTFLGPPSSDLDNSVQKKGHTHYAQFIFVLSPIQPSFVCTGAYDMKERMCFDSLMKIMSNRLSKRQASRID